MIAANVMRAGIVLTILALALASLCACAERRARDPFTLSAIVDPDAS